MQNNAKLARYAIVLSITAVALAAGRLLWPPTPTAPSASRSMVLEQLRKSKKLKAAYVINAPQMSRDAKSGQLSGYAYDFLNKIAADGGFTVDYEETTFSTMGAGLNTGAFDVVIAGGYESVPRAMEVTFTDPLVVLALGYVARADDDRFKTENDLKEPGIRVAVTGGGASADYLKAFLPDAEPVILSRNELGQIVLEVLSGRADVGIGNINNCLRFEQEHPTIRFVTKGKPFFPFTSGFVVRHGDPDWLHFLNSAIRRIQVSGYADLLERRYNPDGLLWIPARRQ